MKKVLGTDGLTLWQLYEDFKSKAIERPDWQRGRAWSDEKRDKWIEDILAIANSFGGGTIAGMIVVFSIAVVVDGQEVGYLGKWLNDGLQRLSALADWIDEMLDETKPKKRKWKKMTKEELMTTLSRVRILVQSCGYSSMPEAFDDFFRLQLGTPCTPTDLGMGILATQPKWNEWKSKFDRLHEIVEKALRKLNVKSRENKKGKYDNKPIVAGPHARDDFALLHRLVTKNTKLENYNVGSQKITKTDMLIYMTRAQDGKKTPKDDSKSPVEERLVKLFDLDSVEKIGRFDAAVNQLDELLNRKVQIFKRLWENAVASDGWQGDDQPQALHVRWWFAVALYAELAGISDEILEKFTDQFVKITKGESRFKSDALPEDILKKHPDVGRNVTIGVGDLSKLKLWAKLLCPEMLHA